MVYLRSTLFQILFYTSTFLLMVLFSPALVLPRKWGWWVVPFWSRFNLVLLRLVVGLRVEVRGRENIPDGGYIVASKHQSAWETFALIREFPDPTYILKRELRWIPIFGWYTAKFRQIPINRGKRSAALVALLASAKEAIAENRQILIFPEGTRRPVGGEPKYKYGIAHLYRDLHCPVLPVALNAGVFWPRASWMVYPGKVIVEILPPIPPDIPADEFHRQLVDTIEGASVRLCEEARQEKPLSPVLARLQVKPASAGE
ncbi:lysophospholipid acyltransferase family protein [Roseibium sp.]|uniref:lysophospholipid acyltransferase family protein n=1 Tax=Roseibium sp. TaxID=1936156 RepID=UPI003A98712D